MATGQPGLTLLPALQMEGEAPPRPGGMLILALHPSRPAMKQLKDEKN